MKNLLSKTYSILLLLLLLSTNILGDTSKNDPHHSTVGHKNIELGMYLDHIGYNSQEKIGILPYILKNTSGNYLEIGTGGDPIEMMLNNIPGEYNVNIIASDIEEEVLNELPKRHPELKKYIDAKTGPRLMLQKLNAIDMNIFESNFFDGINASALLHEIFSYEGGFNGIKKFFKESFRVLKPGGILFYRDPEGISNKNNSVTVVFKDRPIKLFAHIFIYKFLNQKTGNMAKSEIKLNIYSPEDITFKVYKKNDSHPEILTYQEYLDVPSYDIDFSRNYHITMPLGLYRELARHYITYLHQSNPLVFVKCTPQIYSVEYIAHYLAPTKNPSFKTFLEKHNLEIDNIKINNEQKKEIDSEILNDIKPLEFGILLSFSSQIKKNKLRMLLKKYDFKPDAHMIVTSDGDILLDYRVFGMLYDEITETIFDDFNKVKNEQDEEHAKWLKREGEEFYCYYSSDKLISEVLKITLTKNIDQNGKTELFVLCPQSENDNIFIDRPCYTDLLSSCLEVYDSLGYSIEVKDGKRIINFCKMPLKNALDICQKITQNNPLEYPHLQKTITNLKSYENKGD